MMGACCMAEACRMTRACRRRGAPHGGGVLHGGGVPHDGRVPQTGACRMAGVSVAWRGGVQRKLCAVETGGDNTRLKYTARQISGGCSLYSPVQEALP